jgi:hypothetical protein
MPAAAEHDPQPEQAVHLLQRRSRHHLPDQMRGRLLPCRVLDDRLRDVLAGPVDA